MLTAQEVFKANVANLAKSERLKLAALILDDLSQSGAEALDYSDSWSEEDVRDLAAFSLGYASASYPEDQSRA